MVARAVLHVIVRTVSYTSDCPIVGSNGTVQLPSFPELAGRLNACA
jgi:hypothetical protein